MERTSCGKPEGLHETGSTPPDLPIGELSTDVVAKLVAERRRTVKTNAKGRVVLRNDQPVPVSNSYVNRYTWKLLRRVHIMARDRKGISVQAIDWKDKRISLTERGPITREVRIEDELAIETAKSKNGRVRFRDGYAAGFRFLLLTGLRKSNLVITWSMVDFGDRQIIVVQKGKREHVVQIDDETLALLRAQRGRHPEFVFTYVAQRTRKNPRTGRDEEKGRRYPLTVSGFDSWFRHTRDALGLREVTPHTLRRTAGGRILRATGNLKLASQRLGHSDVAITAKLYAHIRPDAEREL